MLTFDLLGPAWTERADRRRSRCAVAGAPAPTSPVAGPHRPRDANLAFATVLESSSRLRFSTPRFLSQPNIPMASPHSPHPLPPHRAHTPPVTAPSLLHTFFHLLTLSRPVEGCEGCPALAGVRKLGLDDPSAGRPDLHCNFGDRSIQASRAATARSASPSCRPYRRHCSAPASRQAQSPLIRREVRSVFNNA